MTIVGNLHFAICILQFRPTVFAACGLAIIMTPGPQTLMLAIALCASLARAEPPPRPDLNAATPIATCKLQTLAASPQPAYDRPQVLYSLQRPADDPLANYERTPLGGWRMPAEADRDDPWLRLLLVGPKRPVVIDLAVFIDGKPFREKREAWIDEVLATNTRADVDAKTQIDGQEDSENKDDSGNKKSDAAGTNEADAASVSDASEAPASGESPPRLGGPTVAAQARKTPTMRERLLDYLATNGTDVQRDELHWLLAEWGAGPAVVVLGSSLSWQRANLAPLVAYLDQDSDGGLSATEIAQAENLLKRADTDANDVVEISELNRQTRRPPASGRATGHSLVLPLDANTDWDSLASEFRRIYGDNVSEATAALTSSQADITLRVDFATAKDDERPAAVSLLSLGSDLQSNGESAIATADVISFDVGGDFVEFAAAQSPAGENGDASATQLAIGAVIDGNPLERLLDRDQDGRFTLRERQELAGLLAALDRNQDGQVAREEIPVPIRLAVTPGPHVHRLLATPTSSARAIAPREAAPAPPDWFLSMDKNADRDLARGEFLGTTEQFRQFDTDGDGLLSVSEALKLSTGQ
jgi:hypothetical protein